MSAHIESIRNGFSLERAGIIHTSSFSIPERENATIHNGKRMSSGRDSWSSIVIQPYKTRHTTSTLSPVPFQIHKASRPSPRPTPHAARSRCATPMLLLKIPSSRSPQHLFTDSCRLCKTNLHVILQHCRVLRRRIMSACG